MDNEYRKKQKILAIKNGMSTIGHDVKEIAISASEKAALTSIIGAGALVAVLGVISQDPAKMALGIGAGGIIDTLAIATLKDTNEFISIKKQIQHLAYDIKESYANVSHYSLKTEGRTL